QSVIFRNVCRRAASNGHLQQSRRQVTLKRRRCQMFSRLSTAVAMIFMLSPAAQAAGAAPTDPQIAHIAYTAGEIDIANAKQALKISKNKEVRAFAENMVKDHTAVNTQAL